MEPEVAVCKNSFEKLEISRVGGAVVPMLGGTSEMKSKSLKKGEETVSMLFQEGSGVDFGSNLG